MRLSKVIVSHLIYPVHSLSVTISRPRRLACALGGQRHQEPEIFGQQCRQTSGGLADGGAFWNWMTENTTTFARPQLGHRGLSSTAGPSCFDLSGRLGCRSAAGNVHLAHGER
jgi:hypothetical protein